MALGRILVAWVVVAAWLLGWQWVERRRGEASRPLRRELGELAGEAGLVTLFGALWFASLGAGGLLAWTLPA